MKAKQRQPKELQDTKEKKKKPRYRVPRPIGITHLCQEYNKGEDELKNPSLPQNKALLRKKIIQRYLQEFLNNRLIEKDNITKQYKQMTIPTLAYLLNTNTTEVMIGITREMERAGMLIDRHGQALARGLTFRAFFESSELSALTSQQLAILMASQGNKYRPFISGEVNRAMANKIAAMRPTLDLLKLMLDKQSGTLGPTNPNVPEAGQKGTVLTVEMAHQMLLEGHQSVMTDGSVLDDILLKDNALKLLPETNPNYQGGDILRSSSLYQNVPEELKDGTQEGHHTEKNMAKRGFEEPLNHDDFVA